jgi:hypothetical protein
MTRAQDILAVPTDTVIAITKISGCVQIAHLPFVPNAINLKMVQTDAALVPVLEAPLPTLAIDCSMMQCINLLCSLELYHRACFSDPTATSTAMTEEAFESLASVNPQGRQQPNA